MWLIQMSIMGFIMTNFSVAGTLSYVGLTGDSGEEEPAADEVIEEVVVVEEPKEAPKPKPAPKKAPAKKAPSKKKEEKKE